jgi:hypothetical protein
VLLRQCRRKKKELWRSKKWNEDRVLKGGRNEGSR